jgi:Rho-binding antiterminator
MTDYRPVDCALHSAYELAILQRRRIRLDWLDGTAERRSETVLPVDLVTRRGEEFLVVRQADGCRADIRLDRILAFPDA